MNEQLIELILKLDGIRNQVSNLRWKSQNPSAEHWSDVACSVESLQQDLIEAANQEQMNSNEFINIPA